MSRLHTALLFIGSLILLLALPGSEALAVSFDGPRSIRELQGPELPLYPVPGAFSILLDPGLAETEVEAQAWPAPPSQIELGEHVLELQGPLGPLRFRTYHYQVSEEVSVAKAQAIASLITRQLSGLPEIVLGAPLYRLSPRDSSPWRAVTPQILVQVHQDSDWQELEELILEMGLEIEGPRGLAPNQWQLFCPPGARVDPIEAATVLHEAPVTRWAQVNWLQPRSPRYIPDDDRFEDQWHLENTGQFGGITGNDVNAVEAWDLGLGTEEAKVAILDSGVDMDHPDLISGLLDGYDFISNDDDPNPGGSGGHGTRVAGVAAAPAQGIGVVGTCPSCPIIPIRMLGGGDAAEADSIDFAVDQGAWIINNSWGPPDGTGEYAPLPAVVQTAIDYAVEQGRDGRGTAIFWAAGNGHPDDTCSDDGYAAYPSVIAIGASTNEGERAGYSERCPELDLSSPSNGGTAGLTTTDIGDYSGSFGGTSGASPVAAGVGGLVLSLVPELTADALHTLLRDTAQPIDPGDADYDDQGHSESYGYGRIDALAALQGEVSILSVQPTATRCNTSLEISLLVGGSEAPTEATVQLEASLETLQLDMEPSEDGLFSLTVGLTDGEPDEDDGLLTVVHGESVLIQSEQAENLQSVSLDCQAPEISGIQVDEISYWGARILWDSSEPAEAYMQWGAAAGEFAQDQSLETGHQLWALNLEPCTDYSALVRSTDSYGNVNEQHDAVSWTSTGNPAELPSDAPNDADPCDPSTWSPGDDDDAGDDDDTGGGNVPRDDDYYTGGISGTGGACQCEAGPNPRGSLPNAALLVLVFGLMHRRRSCRAPSSY